MNKMSKNHNLGIGIALAAFLITGCAKKPDKSQIIAQVNNYQVTINDFCQEAAMSIPTASKEQVLQDIIAKELLLQQAQKMDLDKDKSFMKEIENYWKQALIKRVITKKGDEFLAASEASDDEVKTEYNRMKQESDGRVKPYEQISGQIRDRLKMEKAQAALSAWINSLEKNANIKKYYEIFNDITLKKTINQEEGQDAE